MFQHVGEDDGVERSREKWETHLDVGGLDEIDPVTGQFRSVVGVEFEAGDVMTAFFEESSELAESRSRRPAHGGTSSAAPAAATSGRAW